MTDNSITLRRLRADELDRFCNFLKVHYGDEHYGADKRYVDWLYQQSPSSWLTVKQREREAPVNILIDSASDILSVHAFVPFDARTFWGGSFGIWDLEWINGGGPKGSGRRLAAALLSEVDIYVGFGCNELSENAFKKMGMSFVPEILRAVLVVDPDRLVAELSKLEEVHKVFDRCSFPDFADCSLLEMAASVSSDAIDGFHDMTPLGVTRNREWLAWRYDHHPYLRYPILQNHEGAAVLRLEGVVGSNATICRVMEFLPRTLPAEGLASAIGKFAKDNKCLFVDYFSPSSRHLDALVQSFEAARMPMLRNPRVPYMTQPMRFGNRNAFNMVIAPGARAPSGIKSLELTAFHATKGDANQDVQRRNWGVGRV